MSNTTDTMIETDGVILFDAGSKKTKELVKLLRKEDFVPDMALVREILTREDAEDLMVAELDLALSRTGVTMVKNYSYIINLIVLLGEMRSSKAFPVASKIFDLPQKFLIKLFGDIFFQFKYPFVKMGVGYEDELVGKTTEESSAINDFIVSTLITIYEESGNKNKNAEKHLMDYMNAEIARPDFDPIVIFNMGVLGFSKAEKLFKDGLKKNGKRNDVKAALEAFEVLRKEVIDEYPKNIEELYDNLREFEGNKSYRSQLLAEMESDSYFDDLESDEEAVPEKIHPNQFCPCESGKKYRKCCGKDKK